MFYVFLFIILFIYLPSQWANGASFWESIAPNEPFMFIVWLLVIPIGLSLYAIKTEEDKACHKGETEKEREERIDKENERFYKELRWRYCVVMSKCTYDRAEEMYKLHLITEEQKKLAYSKANKWWCEAEEFRLEVMRKMGDMAGCEYMQKLRNKPDYNDYKSSYTKEGLYFLEGRLMIDFKNKEAYLTDERTGVRKAYYSWA